MIPPAINVKAMIIIFLIQLKRSGNDISSINVKKRSGNNLPLFNVNNKK